MFVAAELHIPLQSICSLTSKLRTPLMSLTWQRTTVAETCKLKAERVNSEAYNEHIKSTHFKKIGYRESPTKTTCYSFEYTISHTVCQQKQKTQYHDAINYICHLQEFKISEHHTHSNHLSSIEDSAECRVLQKTNKTNCHKKHYQQTWQQKTHMQFVSKNFRAMEASSFPIPSDDKQPILYAIQQFAGLCVSLA